MVVIDSLSGYLHAMSDARSLMLLLHELLTYLGQQGVTTMMILSQHGMLASAMTSDVDVSYLADNVILFRYYEYAGEVRQALSVFKRRGGPHERTIRQLALTSERGIDIGVPLREFRGVMTGVPVYERLTDAMTIRHRARRHERPPDDERVLILAPTGRDAALARVGAQRGGAFGHASAGTARPCSRTGGGRGRGADHQRGADRRRPWSA